MAAKTSTKAVQAARLKSYNKAQEQKALDIEDQKEKKAANDQFRKRSERTPYQQRKHDRLLSRLDSLNLAYEHEGEPFVPRKKN